MSDTGSAYVSEGDWAAARLLIVLLLVFSIGDCLDAGDRRSEIKHLTQRVEQLERVCKVPPPITEKTP